jgi:DNA adenine methylase
MPITINPLRYPGAKRTLIDYIEKLLVINNLAGCCFYEPYAGSAVVGIELLRRDIINNLVLCEKDILLFAFWKCVFEKTGVLCKKIIDTPITIEAWKKMDMYRKETKVHKKNLLNLGFAGLFFNRTNFSGILNANPIGGIEQKSEYDISCRFNKQKIISVIKDIAKYKDFVEVYFDDALNFMSCNHFRFIKQKCFVYFDPPYFEKGEQIYRHFYTRQEHAKLSTFVKKIKYVDWLISYDDSPFICNLYSGDKAQYRPLFIDYSCATKKRIRGNELLISNLPLPPFPVSNAVGF